MAQGGEVGLDLEACGRLARNDPLSFARRRFSPLEAEAMQGAGGVFGRRAAGLKRALSFSSSCHAGHDVVANCNGGPLPPPSPRQGARARLSAGPSSSASGC